MLEVESHLIEHVRRVMASASATRLDPYSRRLANLFAEYEPEELAWALAAELQRQS